LLPDCATWPELACHQRFDRAQPPSEFDGRQTPIAVEAAKKILCHGFAFLGVAFHAGGNEVAVGIAPHAGKRHDMVEAAHAGGETAQTIEAQATVARMNGSSTLWGVAPAVSFADPSFVRFEYVYELTSGEFSFIHNGWLW